MDARFVHGEYRAIDYVATADIEGGEVVPILAAGLANGIAHHPIADTDTGSLAIGGGVYEVESAGNYDLGTKVYWDNTAKNVTTTTESNTVFGYLVKAGTTGNLTWAVHDPRV